MAWRVDQFPGKVNSCEHARMRQVDADLRKCIPVRHVTLCLLLCTCTIDFDKLRLLPAIRDHGLHIRRVSAFRNSFLQSIGLGKRYGHPLF